MVLSLPLVLALIGSATGLVVGIMAFGEISDSVECPASNTIPTIITTLLPINFFTPDNQGDYNLVNPINSPTIKLGLINMSFNGESISQITFQILSDGLSSGSIGTIKGVIYSGVDASEIEAGDTSFTLVASSQIFQSPWDDDGAGGSFITSGYHNVTAVFNPSVTVTGSNIFVGVEATGLEDDPVTLLIDFPFVSIQGEICSEWIDPTDFRDCGFRTAMTIEGVNGGSNGGGSDGVGSEQCESAKDIAWSVIGIMPVALFFGLFTLFNFTIGKT